MLGDFNGWTLSEASQLVRDAQGYGVGFVLGLHGRPSGRSSCWRDGLKTDEAVKGHLHFTRDLVWLRRRHPALRGEPRVNAVPKVSLELNLYTSLGDAVCGLYS